MYSELVSAALAELTAAGNRIDAKNARLEFFRNIANRQQLDTISMALTSNTTKTN